MKSCREVRRALSRSLEGERSLREEFAIEAHVADCEACRGEYEKGAALREAFLNLPLPPLERLDLARSLAAIDARLSADAMPAHRGPRFRVVALASVAAAALALTALWFFGAERARERGLAEAVPAAPEPRPLEVAEASPTERSLAPSNLDRARLSAARAEVRAALASVRLAPLAATEEVAEVARDIDRHVRHLAETDWPVVRMVEGFVGDEDPGVARVAVRYLGFVGQRASIPNLRAELGRGAGAAEAVLALADAGEEGLDGLAEAVWNEAARELALACLRRPEWRGPQRFEWLERALQRRPRRVARELESTTLRGILGVLALEGERGADALLARTRRRDVPRELVLDVLAGTPGTPGTPGARESVMNEMLRGGAGVDEGFLLDCAARMEIGEALDWISAQAERGPFQQRALQVIAELPGPAALEALVHLERVHRPPERDFLASWQVALRVDAERARRVALDATEWSGERARHFLELLVVSEVPEAVPAIATLVGESRLANEDREWAMHSVLELARAEHAEDLRALLPRFGPGDSRLAALCLMALAAVDDPDLEPDLEDHWLAELSDARRAQVRALLETKNPRRVSATTLLRIGRELKPLLEPKPTEFWRRTQ